MKNLLVESALFAADVSSPQPVRFEGCTISKNNRTSSVHRPRPLETNLQRFETPFPVIFGQARHRTGVVGAETARAVGADPSSSSAHAIDFGTDDEDYFPDAAPDAGVPAPAHEPDAGILAAIRGPARGDDAGVVSSGHGANVQRASCPGASVACVDGYAGERTCAAACGGRCCVGDYACDGLTAEVCADGESCRGKQACYYANIGLISRACNGIGACNYTGYDGTVSEVVDGCLGDRA